MGCYGSYLFLSKLVAFPHFHNSTEAIFRLTPDSLWREFTSKHTSWLTTGQRHVSNVATRTNRKPQAAQLKKNLALHVMDRRFVLPPLSQTFYGLLSRWVRKTNTADFLETLHLESQVRITTNCTPISWIPFVVENAVTFVTDNDIRKIYLTLRATFSLWQSFYCIWMDCNRNHPFIIKILAGLTEFL